MNIGIVSHINPYELREYIYDNHNVPDTKVSASSVHALIVGLIKQGHFVSVFSHTPARYVGCHFYKLLEGERLKVYLIPTIPRLDPFIRSLYLPDYIAKTIKLELGKLEVLHAQWTYENAAALLKYSKTIPSFCSVRDWWPVQRSYFSQSSLSNRALWGWSNKRMFYEVMNDSRIHFVANSEYTQQMVLSMKPEYDVPIIQNPIKEKYIIQNRPCVFNNVFIAILPHITDKRKNCESLVKAFAAYKNESSNAKLVLIGDYNCSDEVICKWEKMGLLDGIELCGFLSHDDVIKKLDESSVLIHPSLEETYGNILLEGMARRVLVVGGRDSGAVPSVLGHGKFGVLCDVSNSDDILKTMKLISMHFYKYDSVINAATNHLIDDLTDAAIADKYIQLYRKATLLDN